MRRKVAGCAAKRKGKKTAWLSPVASSSASVSCHALWRRIFQGEAGQRAAMQIRMHRNSCCKSRACHLASPWQQKSGTTDADTSPSPAGTPKTARRCRRSSRAPSRSCSASWTRCGRHMMAPASSHCSHIPRKERAPMTDRAASAAVSALWLDPGGAVQLAVSKAGSCMCKCRRQHLCARRWV